MMKRSKNTGKKNVLCPVCNKPVRRIALKDHAAHVHGVKRYVLAKRKNPATYSVSNIGNPWRGGLPGLGKRR